MNDVSKYFKINLAQLGIKYDTGLIESSKCNYPVVLIAVLVLNGFRFRLQFRNRFQVGVPVP